jgi:uncharacterized protein
MLKILLVIGVIAFVYYFFIKKKTISYKDKNGNNLQSNDMVECIECGTYCEISESILSQGRYYCSKECLGKAK